MLDKVGKNTCRKLGQIGKNTCGNVFWLHVILTQFLRE